MPLSYRHMLCQCRSKCKYVQCNFGHRGPIKSSLQVVLTKGTCASKLPSDFYQPVALVLNSLMCQMVEGVRV